jgi:hypothetical protein
MSQLHRRLSRCLAQFPVDYLSFGDAAYPILRYITRGTRRPKIPVPSAAGRRAAQNRRKMSKVRECVEWGFGKIVNLWAYLDFIAIPE